MSKLLALSEAVARYIPDGAALFIGGFGHCIPFAGGHEIIRQEKRDLTICRSGSDILFDQLIAAGCVSKVVFGYIGNPGVGLAHNFRKAVEAKQIELEEWTNFTLVLRLHAARIGVPFLPTRALLAGDVTGASANVVTITCPFTGEPLAAVPALAPDVALIHGQRADEDGNVQLWGIDGDTREGAHASRSVIVTVEEVVSRAELRRMPERTVVPSSRVAAVSVVPGGAHPSYVQDYYGRDDAHFMEYDGRSRTTEGVQAYLDEFIRNIPDRDAYLKLIDPAVRGELDLPEPETTR